MCVAAPTAAGGIWAVLYLSMLDPVLLSGSCFLANQIPHNFTLTPPPPLPAANLVHRYLIWDLRLFAMNCLDVALGYGFFFIYSNFFPFFVFRVFFLF